MNKEVSNEIQSYLSFTLKGELFAIHVKYVLKILEMTSFTRIPQGPHYLLGVINLTGSVLPVIDTCLKFGFESCSENQAVILVLEVEMNGKPTQIGITADTANEVFEASDAMLKPYPALGGKFNSEFIKGVIDRKGQFVLILNVDKLFDEEELNGFAEVTT